MRRFRLAFVTFVVAARRARVRAREPRTHDTIRRRVPPASRSRCERARSLLRRLRRTRANTRATTSWARSSMHELAANDGTITFVRGDSIGHVRQHAHPHRHRRLEVLVPPHQQRHTRHRRRQEPRGLALRTRHSSRHEGEDAGSSSRTWATAVEAETTDPHLHFELHRPNDTFIDPYTSLRISRKDSRRTGCAAYRRAPRRNQNAAAGRGFWTLDSDGKVMSFGSVRTYGTAARTGRIERVRSRIAPTRIGQRLLGRRHARHVHAFGDAVFYGQASNLKLKAPVLSHRRHTERTRLLVAREATAASSPTATRASSVRRVRCA